MPCVVTCSYVDPQRLMCVIAPDACDSLPQHVCMYVHVLVMPIFFNVLVQYLTFLTVVKQMHVVVLLGTVFP